jgi:hypothetical protein
MNSVTHTPLNGLKVKLKQAAESRLAIISSSPISTHRESGPACVRIEALLTKLEEVQRVLLGPHQRFEEAVRTKNPRTVESLVSTGEISPDVWLPTLVSGTCTTSITGGGTADADDVGSGFHSEPTLLHWSLADASLVQTLLARGAAVDRLGPNLCTPLHHATELGKVDVVAILLANKADVNSQQGAGQTPLHLAALAGHVHLTELLRSHGASLVLEDEEGDMPFHSASDLQMMSSLAMGAQRVGVAILSGRGDQVGLLIREGVCDVNDMCIKNKTALHLARGARI